MGGGTVERISGDKAHKPLSIVPGTGEILINESYFKMF